MVGRFGVGLGLLVAGSAFQGSNPWLGGVLALPCPQRRGTWAPIRFCRAGALSDPGHPHLWFTEPAGPGPAAAEITLSERFGLKPPAEI